MKTFIHKFILLIILVAVFFTGTGVTIIDFCCSLCSTQTLVMTSPHDCCSEKKEDRLRKKQCCSEKEQNDGAKECHKQQKSDVMHCKASRLTVDIDAFSFKPQLIIPHIWIADIACSSLSGMLTNQSQYVEDCFSFKSPPIISPRNYLSIIRILII